MPPRAFASEDLSSHQPISSVQIDPQKGCASWLYSAVHLLPKTQNQRAPLREKGEAVGLNGLRRETERKKGRKRKRKERLLAPAALVP